MSSDNQNAPESTLLSCSSKNSVHYNENVLKADIDAVKNSSITLHQLAADAEKLLDDTFRPDPRTLLSYAEEWGGENGKRYVASAVMACSRKEYVVQVLQALGITWLTHLLFTFKTSHGNENQANDEAFTHFSMPVVGDRKSSFRGRILARDGYRCVVTGIQDEKHPMTKLDNVMLIVELEVAHIMHRGIDDSINDSSSPSYKSAVTTFDIIINFTQLSKPMFQDLDYHTSNSMMLQHDLHRAYDKFLWCLKKTEKQHVYRIKYYKNANALLPQPNDDQITFDLPNPHHIAIHAAIAEILHTSGAGKFFDDILRIYQDEYGNNSTVRSWLELEDLMRRTELLRESITQAFQSTNVR
ncbi:hypothetical protein BDN70DRAFT_932821 [Pholiota conissans]|uniref:HNH nuclease domain-containing protein n=1 Tax=Pholiota conissans TaxID=109636 RepID=A0A9P5Z1U7_9AGAR|nr:hypothetical protein BDN70DRAFT_932821 [Pholiota conissans]